MASDHYLTEDECRIVAKKIDAVLVNIRYPGEDDWRNFMVLMYELHQKKFCLHDASKSIQFCKKPFPAEVREEMRDRIENVSGLVFGQDERRQSGRGDYLPADF